MIFFIYAYGIQNTVSGLLQLSYLLMDFKVICHMCQNDMLRAKPGYSTQRSRYRRSFKDNGVLLFFYLESRISSLTCTSDFKLTGVGVTTL